MISKVLRRLRSRKVAVGFGAAIAVATGYGLFILTLPMPKLWITIAASTERLAFKVANPDLAVVRVAGMEAFTQDGKLSGCVSGILQPVSGATVEYRRGDDTYFRILVDSPARDGKAPAATFRPAGAGAATTVTGSLILRAHDLCGSVPKRLPVWGDGELGDRSRSASAIGEITPGLLTGGKVTIYAHSHPVLLGLDFPSTIYLVNSFDIPAGAVLSKDPGASTPLWTGTASVAGNGFDVRLSTSSKNLALRVPSSGGEVGASSIDLGSYSQLLKDPNIVKIQFIFGVFLFVFHTILSISAFFIEEDS